MIDVFFEKHGSEIPKTKQTMTTLCDYLAEQLPLHGATAQLNYWKMGKAKTTFMSYRNGEAIRMATEVLNSKDFEGDLNRIQIIMLSNAVAKYYEADFSLSMDAETIKYLLAIIIDAEAYNKEVLQSKAFRDEVYEKLDKLWRPSVFDK